MWICLMLFISILLLSLVAFDMRESFAAGYKPPTRTSDLNYNVPAGVSPGDASHATKPRSFDFGAGNWGQFSGGGIFGKGPFG